MKSLLMATAIGLALSAPALAQQGPATPHHPQQSANQGPQAASNGTIAARLMSAEQLIRKNVVTADDQDLGNVDYIVVDPATGSIATLLIRATGLSGQGSSGQNTSGQGANQGNAPLLAMPWHAIDVTQGRSGDVIAKVPMRVARQVPTFTDADISRVTSPRMMARLVEYYAPAPQGGPSNQGGASSQMVVGHGLVGMLAPPAVTTVDQMQGLAITTPDGSRIGEIQSVMIDVEQGAVSYLLALQQSDRNRMTRNTPPLGTGYIPIAYQDVELAADGQSFVLAPEAMVVGVVAMPADQRQSRGGNTQNRQAQAGMQRGYGADAYGASGGNRQSAQAGSQPAGQSGQQGMTPFIELPDPSQNRSAQQQQRNAQAGNRSGQQASAQSAQPQLGGQSGRQGEDRYVERTGQSGNRAAQQQGNAQADDRSGQQQAGAQPGRISRAVLGTVQSVDQRSGILTLENGSSFQLAQNIDPSSISSGDPVRIRYRVRGNDYQAVSVEPAPESALSGSGRADAATGPVDGTDAPGATDDPRQPRRNN